MFGLVLEGGGARGAYHVGAYKAIRELNIEIGGIAGTSIGAINGAMMVQGDYELLEKIWLSVDSYELFDLDEKTVEDLRHFNLRNINFSYLLHQSKEILSNRGLDTSRIRELFDYYIDEEKIRSSNIDFGIVTVNLTDKKPMELMKEDIPEGKLIDFLIASANLPAFRIEEMDGKKYLEGGFYNNLPIDILANKGYKNIIAVRTLAIGIIRKAKIKDLNIIFIQPVESLGSMLGALDFNRERAEEYINLGYYDAMKVFKKLKGFKYYCIPFEGNFINILTDFYNKYKERLCNIGRFLGYEDVCEDRMFFEKIIPRLESILDMKGKNDYQDICIRFFERIAEKYGVERFKIYKAEEFVELTIEKFRENPTAFIKNVPNFIKQNRILSLAVKDDLIVEIFAELFL
ncbi:MAG TPA: patatin-like phospholipase family protein [Sedimentibacter sp.]|nr:patatin-like phospholipase family protein [Sedimentibacter sp.]